MEKIVERMQDETTGVPVRTVKSFMTKIPSVFTGSDLIMWMLKNLDIDDQQEALHLAHLMAAHGYFFPIDDHMLSVKNDSTYYRFQTPYFWPSNCWEPENTDYGMNNLFLILCGYIMYWFLQLCIYAKEPCRIKRDWNWPTMRLKIWRGYKRCFLENGSLFLCKLRLKVRSTKRGINWRGKCWTVKRELFGMFIDQWWVY